MKILITICGRGGSKGIAGKNIKEINNVPLIAYSINTAKKFAKNYDSTIALSTDSDLIKQVASKYGLKTEYTRPEHLASDTAAKVDAIKDILLFEENKNKVKYDYLLDLDITSPLRNLDDLNSAFKMILEDTDCLTLFSVNKPHRNPYFNMVEEQPNGYFSIVKKMDGVFLTRQSTPKVYDVNASFYFYRREFFDLGLKTPLTDKTLVYITPHICFDVDEEVDFTFLTYLIENNKLDFSL